MRPSIILVALALSLGSCGKKDAAGNAVAGDQGLTAESIVANDVTAIDAVTADAANMAADVDINFTNEFTATTTNTVGQGRSGKAIANSTPKRRDTSAEPPTPSSNSATTNTTANLTE